MVFWIRVKIHPPGSRLGGVGQSWISMQSPHVAGCRGLYPASSQTTLIPLGASWGMSPGLTWPSVRNTNTSMSRREASAKSRAGRKRVPPPPFKLRAASCQSLTGLQVCTCVSIVTNVTSQRHARALPFSSARPAAAAACPMLPEVSKHTHTFGTGVRRPARTGVRRPAASPACRLLRRVKVD